MLYIDIHNDETGEVVRVGKLEDFVNLLTDEVGSVATVITKNGFRKRAVASLHRVIQKARDNAKTQR